LRDYGFPIRSPLGNLNTALYTVATVDIWHYWGFLTVVYLAALRQTPYDQVEAAMVEGANGWQLFRHVYFPSIRPTVQLMFVMIIIFSFMTFDYIYLLTGGGPAHATEMLSTYAYTFAFMTFQFGKASAVGLMMSLFGLLASFLYVWLSRKDIAA
jgi:raffinose/stachyose/melibiose transport system permease protein